MVLSVGLSILTVWASIALAYVLNWPIGFFVGVLAAVLYGFGRLWAWLSARGRSLTNESAAPAELGYTGGSEALRAHP